MNIFESLRADHDKQRQLVELLIRTHGDSNGRDELFGRLKSQLTRHAAAEERCLYVPMMQHDLTQEKARHSVAEHHEIDEAIEALENDDYASPGWLAKAKKLGELVEHHLDEEEQEVFQMAGKVLSDEEKSSLASSYVDEMKTAKAQG